MKVYCRYTLLLSILCLFHYPAKTNTEADNTLACDVEFSFTTVPCSQSVLFWPTQPAPVDNPDLTFTWDFGDGSLLATGDTIVHNYIAPGGGTRTFTVKLTVTETSTGCMSMVVHMITIDEKPHALITDTDIFSPFAYCDGDISTLTVLNASTTTSENVNYHIDWGDGTLPFTASSFTSTTHTYNGQGGYPIILAVTGQNGCTSTFATEFYMGGNPAVGISIPSLGNICNSTIVPVNLENWQNNSPGTVYIITSNSSPNPLFTFNHPPPATVNVTFGSSSCGFVTGTYQDAFNVKVEAVNPCGTASATAEPIRVSAPPTAAIQKTLPPNGCPGQPYKFCDASFGAGYYISSLGACTKAVLRQWNITPGAYSLVSGTLTDSCITVVFNAPGLYNVCLTTNNPCGPSTACETVVVAETPVAHANASIAGTGCTPMTVTFQNLSQNNTTNGWTIAPNTGWTGNLNVPSPTVTFTAPGSYLIQLTVSNACGNATWDTTIIVRALPVVSIPAVPIICAGGQIAPTANVTGNGCATSCSWSFPGGNPSSFTGCTPPQILYNTAGNYTYSVTVTNCCGQTTASQTVTVSGIPMAEADAVLSNGQSCAPMTVVLQNLSQNNPNNTWMITPASGWSGNLNTPNPTVSFTTTGTYTLNLTVSAGICGTDTWDTTLVVRAKPTVNILADNIICIGESFTPTASVVDNGCMVTVYNWSFPGGLPAGFIGLTPPPVVYNTPGAHTFTFTALNCCDSTTVSHTMIVEDFTVVSSPDTLELCVGASCATLTGSPANCTWSQNGVPLPGIQFCPVITGTFKLVYTCGSANCPSRDTTTIIVHPLPLITGMPPPLVLCVNSAPEQLIATPDNGNTWWTGVGIDSAGWFDPAMAGAGGTMTYHHLDAATGCENAQTVAVTVNPVIALNLPDSTFCNSTQLVLENEYQVIELAGESCDWFGNGITNGANGTFVLPAGTVLPATFTVYYTFSSAADCSVIDSVAITIVPLQPAFAGNDTTLCGTGTYQLLGNFGQVKWTGPTSAPPITSNGVVNLDLAASGVHTYTYTYTAFEGSSCESSDQVNVTIIKMAGINAGVDQYFCVTDGIVTIPLPAVPPGNTVTLSGQGVVDGILGQVNVAQILAGSCVPLTATVVSNTLASCSTSDQFQCCVYDLPVVNFSITGQDCVDSLHYFQNFSNSATRFCWDFGDNTPIVCLTEPPPHQYATAGDFVVTLTAWSVNPLNANDTLCIQQKTDTLHITAPPQKIDFIALPADSCADLTLYLTNISEGESLEFAWYKDGILFSTATNPSPILLTQGFQDTTYTITLRVLNGCGGGDVSKTIQVRPRPVSDIGSNLNTYCSGEPILLTNNSHGNVDTYRWYQNGVLVSSDSIPPYIQVLTDTLITIEICLITSNECGTDTMCLTRIVQPASVNAFFFTDTTEACVGQPICFTNLSSSWASSYFEFGDGSGSVNQNPCHAYAVAGEYDVVLRASGCGYDSFTVHVIIRPLPTPSFSHVGIPCPGKTFLFNNTSANGVDFLWKFGDGTSTTLFSPVHIYNVAGNFTTCLIVTSLYSCKDSICHTVHVEPDPVAAIAPVDSICVGDTVLFTSLLDPGTANCTWTFSDGFFADGCAVSHAFAQSGDYIALLEVENHAGCRDTASILVHVRPTPTANFTYEILDPCTPGAKVRLVSNSTGATGIRWYIDGQYIQQSETFDHIFDLEGPHVVKLIASNGGICAVENTQMITLQARPKLHFETGFPCGVKLTNLIIDVDAPGSFDARVFNDIYDQPGTRHDSLPDGLYHILVTSDNGCETDTSLTLVAPSVLSISLSPDSSRITLGETVHLQMETNLGNETIAWSPGSWLSDQNSFNPIATPYKTITYQAVVTSEQGCTETETAFIEVVFELDSSLYVPNVFTPNGDNRNDVFRLRSKYPAVSYVKLFQVFARGGQKVFEAKDFDPKILAPETEWDGTYLGEVLPPSSFAWLAEVIFADGSSHVFHGEVLLVR